MNFAVSTSKQEKNSPTATNSTKDHLKILDFSSKEDKEYAKNKEDIMLETDYGIKFTSGVSKDNIFGVQFHPEKSHKYGMKLMKKFIKC